MGRRVPTAILPALVVAALTLGPAGQGWSAASPLGPGPSAAHAFGSHLTLAQAPAALRGAVVGALGRSFTIQELTASDGNPKDFFGISVALSGTTALVGTDGPGVAYVFTESAGVWSQQAELSVPGVVENDWFGTAVALSGTTALVGAYGEDGGAGAAYAFTESDGVWSEQAELTASDAEPGDEFGTSVALSGTAALIGAEGSQSGGQAYVFTERAGVWQQQAELTAPGNTGPYNFFGSSVALSGTRALIGADNTNSATGAAYVFTEAGGVWSEQAELTASDASTGAGFGSSVALSGTTALIGSWLKASETGAAYVFTGVDGVWSQKAELTASDAGSSDRFGFSVALAKTTALIGAPGVRGGVGATYVFRDSDDVWSQRAEETVPGSPNWAAALGCSVAISGSKAIVGAETDADDDGAVFVAQAQ